ncbi:MAG TPA: site-specific DNA-methyltransferase [Armatimonadota bacterium]|nr:site-specific DNA-methyltransferase [Armatimonadota bacterium]
MANNRVVYPERSRGERRKKDSARLVWDTKPRRAPNPRDIEFQTAEVVIPNPARDAATLPFSFRDGLFGDEELDKQQMNRLIWGDNLLAMQALLAQGYEGKINLIYIDPPFASSEDYYYQLTIAGDEVTKQPSALERLAYKDFWAGGSDSYLDMLYPRLQLMKRLLADTGTIYVHMDWHVGHYVKVVMDEIFGVRHMRNEIVWHFPSMSASRRDFPDKHNVLFRYVKSDEWTFNADDVRVPYEEASADVMSAGYGGGLGTGGVSVRKAYGHELGKVPDTVWRIRHVSSGNENTGFPSQKPEPLLERIIKASSSPGDIVADLFCGSGTTLAIAETLGRRWMGCDFGKTAIQVARTRLVEDGAKPFLIENIGNYQREMIYLTGGRIGEMQRIILKLYGATPRPRTNDLGARQVDDGVLELVYVGYPDRPVSARKVEELAHQAEALDGTGYRRLVILAWDYEYNYSTALENRLKASKRPAKVRIESRFIPPDIYDYLKRAKDEGDIEPLRDKVVFHEKPYLRLAKPVVKKKKDGAAEVTIGIERYVLFDIPVQKQEDREELLALAKNNFAVLIDYWAVDWEYDGYTFKSQWQALRGNGRRTRVVPTTVTHNLPAGKTCTIAVRLVDVFGNDAAGTVNMEL